MRLENLSHHIIYALFPPDALMFIRLFLTPGEVEVPRFTPNTGTPLIRRFLGTVLIEIRPIRGVFMV